MDDFFFDEPGSKKPEYQSQLDDILKNARTDFSASRAIRFPEPVLDKIVAEAEGRLMSSIASSPPQSGTDLAARWNAIVTDFYENAFWGFGAQIDEVAPVLDTDKEEKVDPMNLLAFIRTAFFPTLVIKSFILYFGLLYSQHPGEGYGWGLLITIVVSLAAFAKFIWKQAHLPEEKQQR